MCALRSSRAHLFHGAEDLVSDMTAILCIRTESQVGTFQGHPPHFTSSVPSCTPDFFGGDGAKWDIPVVTVVPCVILTSWAMMRYGK